MQRPHTQPNIVFVDDDRTHLDSLAAGLADHEGLWRIEYCTNPHEALELLRKRDVDVFVTDLHMPTLGGIDLLEQVRAIQPQAVRIVLSGGGGEDELLRAIPFAHQWLAKPVDPVELHAALDRAITSGTFVHRDDLRAILGNTQALPSIPSLFAEVARLIADEEVDLARISAVVERDPAMAAKVLQMANCAYYRPEQPLSSIREATMRIGLRTLANCVLAAEMFVAMPRQDRQTAAMIDLIEKHAREQTELLTRLCETDPSMPPELREVLPTTGLLHEIGALVLLQFDPLSHRTAQRLAQRHRHSVTALENRLIGASHHRVAGTVLGLWGLPWPLVDIVSHHHDPDRCHARRDPCAMLAAAEVFVATPWLAQEFADRAAANGWGRDFAAWQEIAEGLEEKPSPHC